MCDASTVDPEALKKLNTVVERGALPISIDPSWFEVVQVSVNVFSPLLKAMVKPFTQYFDLFGLSPREKGVFAGLPRFMPVLFLDNKKCLLLVVVHKSHSSKILLLDEYKNWWLLEIYNIKGPWDMKSCLHNSLPTRPLRLSTGEFETLLKDNLPENPGFDRPLGKVLFSAIWKLSSDRAEYFRDKAKEADIVRSTFQTIYNAVRNDKREG